jgi:phage tail tube protein FII
VAAAMLAIYSRTYYKLAVRESELIEIDAAYFGIRESMLKK